MSSITQEFIIINGPSKWDLVVSFFSSWSEKNYTVFTATKTDQQQLTEGRTREKVHLIMRILKLSHKDLSGDQFLFEGLAWSVEKQRYWFTGAYNVRDRSGQINLELVG